MSEIDDQISTIIKNYSNVYYLNNDEHIIDDVVILGSTLWSDVTGEEVYIKQMMNDYSKIYINNPHKTFITPKDTLQLYKKNVLWLEHKITQHKDKKIVILTHHLPTYQLVPLKYKNNRVNCAFASNLEYMMENVNVWLCGHTHTFGEVKINKCLCVVNPVGYPNENISYADKIILIE